MLPVARFATAPALVTCPTLSRLGPVCVRYRYLIVIDRLRLYQRQTWVTWGRAGRRSSAGSPAVVHGGAEVLVVQGLDRAELGLRQRRQAGGLGVLPGLGGAAGAGDHGCHPGLLDDPAQRPLRGRAAGQAAGNGRELG